MSTVLVLIILYALVLSVTGTVGPEGFPTQETILQSANPISASNFSLEQLSFRITLTTMSGGAWSFWMLLTVGMFSLGMIVRLTRMIMKTKF